MFLTIIPVNHASQKQFQIILQFCTKHFDLHRLPSSFDDWNIPIFSFSSSLNQAKQCVVSSFLLHVTKNKCLGFTTSSFPCQDTILCIFILGFTLSSINKKNVSLLSLNYSISSDHCRNPFSIIINTKVHKHQVRPLMTMM